MFGKKEKVYKVMVLRSDNRVDIIETTSVDLKTMKKTKLDFYKQKIKNKKTGETYDYVLYL